MTIREGDWVVVLGEANKCFKVIDVTSTEVILSTGCTEPIDKCTKVIDALSIHTDYDFYTLHGVERFYCDTFPK